MTLSKILRAYGACDPGYAWAKRKTAKQAWETCERPDWMLWALGKIRYDDQNTLRILACRFVREIPLGDGRTVWDLLTDPGSRTAVEVSERYAVGIATYDELESARAAAWTAADAAWTAADAAAWTAADAAAWTARAAAWTARAAAWTAARAADASLPDAAARAADAAARAADAAARAADAAAADASLPDAKTVQCTMIREAIPWETIAPLVAAIEEE